MALSKVKVTRFGVDANYHRVVQLNCNYDRLDAVCVIATYLNEAARLANESPIESFKLDLSGQFHNAHYTDAEDAMKNISLKEAYKALKQMALDEASKPNDPDSPSNEELIFFSDAEDV